MKSLSTPKLVRKLRGRVDELCDIVDELTQRRVELEWDIDSRYISHDVYRKTPRLTSATRKETL